jgi:hypothetical protein
VGERKRSLPSNSNLTDPAEGYHRKSAHFVELDSPLRFLSAKEIAMIDDFLSAIDKRGELKLVVHKGRLRFVTRTQDYEIQESGHEGGT